MSGTLLRYVQITHFLSLSLSLSLSLLLSPLSLSLSLSFSLHLSIDISLSHTLSHSQCLFFCGSSSICLLSISLPVTMFPALNAVQVRLRTSAVPCLCAITREVVSVSVTPGRAATAAATLAARRGSAAAPASVPDTEVAMFVLIVTSDAVVHYYRLDTAKGGECKLEKVRVWVRCVGTDVTVVARVSLWRHAAVLWRAGVCRARVRVGSDRFSAASIGSGPVGPSRTGWGRPCT